MRGKRDNGDREEDAFLCNPAVRCLDGKVNVGLSTPIRLAWSFSNVPTNTHTGFGGSYVGSLTGRFSDSLVVDCSGVET